MLKRLRKKISDEAMSAVVYLVSSVIAKGLAIITVPIFTRIMTIEQVGIVNLYTSWYAILSGIVTLGLTSGGLMMSLNKYIDDQDAYLSSILTLTTGGGIAFGVLFAFFSKPIQQLLNLPYTLIILMSLCFIFCPAYDLWLAKQRFNYRYKLSGIVMTLSALVGSVVAIVAVVSLPEQTHISEAEARLFGTYIVTISVAIIIWFKSFRRGKALFKVDYWKFSLSLSIPLIGQMLAAQVLGFSDRIMIEEYCGAGKVGIYSTIYTVGTLTTMLWTAVNGSYTPYIYKNIKSNSLSVKHSSKMILGAFSVVSIIVVLFGPEITRIVGTSEYYKGLGIIPPVAAGVYLIAIGDLYSDLLIYVQKTKIIMLGTALGAGVNVVLNALFIPKIGYIVAAYTTLISYLTMVIFLILSTNRYYKRKQLRVSEVLDQKRIILLSVITIIIDLVAVLLYENSAIRSIVASVFIVILVYLIIVKDSFNILRSK